MIWQSPVTGMLPIRVTGIFINFPLSFCSDDQKLACHPKRSDPCKYTAKHWGSYPRVPSPQHLPSHTRGDAVLA